MSENSVMKIKGTAVVATEMYNTAKRLVVPDGIDEIGYRAFCNCDKYLEEVVLPESVQIINDKAFAHCDHLKKLNIPAGVKRIGAWAFCGNAVPYITIPDGITRIEEHTFCGTSVNAVFLPDSVEFIGKSAFVDSGVRLVFIPKGVKTIERDAFKNCGNLTIYCEGEPTEGWVSTVETVIEREYITTAEDDAFNFHRSGGSFTSHAVEIGRKQVAVDWNPDNRPVHFNSSRADFESAVVDASAARILKKYRAAFEELAK